MDKKTEILITKFLTNEANIDELRQLELWINNPKNEILFFEHIKTNAFANMVVSKYDIKKAKKDILGSIRKEKRKSNNILKYVAAAVFIGILASSYFFRDNVFNNPIENSPVIVNSIETGTDKATLTLSDGSVVALEKGASFKTKNANSNGEQIVYGAAKKNKNSKTRYNYLTVPRGGQFFVKLSDGTQVWLNSESQLKYPESFIYGETRKVELVYGEAYFDVSPSTEHKGAKFQVFNQSQEIEVLGTEFNIKAYKDETNIYTTLVEGKVVVDNGVLKQNLTPNQQSTLNVLNNNMSVAVVDVYTEISWKNGIFSFKGKSLKDIMKVISRWYDIDVIFESAELEGVTFKGVLGKDQNIEEILLTIKTLSIIKDYEITNNKIILR